MLLYVLFCIFHLFSVNNMCERSLNYMKKLILLSVVALVFFSGCGSESDAGGAGMSQEQQMKAQYSDDNLSFDIPASWQKNFKAVTRDVGSSGNTYPQTDFYYTEGNRDIRLMSIGKFTRDQWDKMKNDGKVGDDAMLGNSADNAHVYSIFYEDHDYIEDGALKESLKKIKSEAEEMRDKMKIK